MNMLSAPRVLRPTPPRDIEYVLSQLPCDADIDASTLSTAFLASPYASFILDQDARVLVSNRRAERMYVPTSITSDDGIVGLPMHKLTKLTHEEFADALRSGAARSSVELPMVPAARTSAARPTVFRVALLRSPARGDRLYLLTQDHLKAAAEALGQMNLRRIKSRKELAHFEARFVDLHASLMAMESFAQQASHDLRTPLSTLSGLIQLFESKFGTEMPDKAHDYLAVMSRAVVQMDALTSDFLEHARSVSSEISAEPLDVRRMIEDVRRDLQNGLTESDMTLRIDGPGCMLMAEPALLRMMLMNLLSNALKYQHPDRHLEIVVSLVPGEGAETMLHISDNGRGFDPAEAEMIFLPFRRYHTSIEGTGIGLSTCAEVCRRHGWSICATSDGNSGATFSITLPQTQKPLQNP